MSTLPSLLLERAASAPRGVAMRRFKLGTWQQTTWADLVAEASAVGSGLAALGVGPGDVVGIVTDDGPEWIAAEIGAQGIGATVLGLDPDLSPPTLRRLVHESGAIAIVVGDQEQFDKVDFGCAALPELRMVIVIDTRGMRGIDADGRADAASVLSLGQLRARGATANDWERRAGVLTADAAAVILASGHDNEVETARLTHAESIAHGRSLAAALGLGGADVLYSQHTLADPVEHSLAVVGPLLHGSTTHFGETGLHAQGLRQVQPTLLYARPAWLTFVSDEAAQRVAGSKGIKRAALRRGFVRRPPATTIRTSRHANPARTVGLGAAALVALLYVLWPSGDDATRLLITLAIVLGACAALVLSGRCLGGPIRRRFGLSRCRAVVMEGGPDATGADFLGALDVPLVTPAVLTGQPVPRSASEARS